MNAEHIDFISAYCDRWCERCPLTHRCSLFKAISAIAICEDQRAGIELALGPAPDDDGVVEHRVSELAEALEGFEPMSPEETAKWLHEEEQRRQKVDATGVMQMVRAFTHLAHPWLLANRETLAGLDAVVREALDIAHYDVTFIPPKLHRALDGFELRTEENGADEGPIQNDWNGSAKIALISIVRSADAWSVLAAASGQETPATLAAQLTGLRRDVEEMFPDAWKFRRPGFDEG